MKYVEMENVEDVPSVVSAACVLHNFCLLIDDGTIEDFFDDDDDDDDDVDDDDGGQTPFPVPRPQAVAKRNQMVIFLHH